MSRIASRIVYGAGPVAELVRAKARSISVLYVSEKRSRDTVARDARNRGVDVEVARNAGLDELASGARHQGLVAITGEFQYAELGGLIDALTDVHTETEADAPGLVVALDGVQDPRNLGAIARSAYLLGVIGIVIPRDRAAGVTASATKTSAGATEHIAIAQVTNLARSLAELKSAGLWIAGLAGGMAAGAETITVADLPKDQALCLVLGAEGSGLRNLVARKCDYLVEIPMRASGVGSFNVSVAAAIAMYEIKRAG